MANIYLSDEIKENFCELMQWYIDEHGPEFRLALLNSDGLMTRTEHEREIESAINDYREDADELSKKTKKLEEKIEKLKDKHKDAIQEKDDEIARIMRKAESELDKAKRIIQELSDEKHGLEDNVARLESDKRELENDVEKAAYYIDQQEKALNVKEVELKEAKNVADTYSQNYSDVEKAWGWFSDLSPDFQEGVSAALGGVDSKLSLVCGAAQENNLRALWEYINFQFNSDELSASDIDNAKKLFIFCVEAVNMSMQSPNLKLVSAEIGQNFNSMTMCKANISKQLGTVARQIIPGFMYISSSKVQKQAMVVLE